MQALYGVDSSCYQSLPSFEGTRSIDMAIRLRGTASILFATALCRVLGIQAAFLRLNSSPLCQPASTGPAEAPFIWTGLAYV